MLPDGRRTSDRWERGAGGLEMRRAPDRKRCHTFVLMSNPALVSACQKAEGGATPNIDETSVEPASSTVSSFTCAARDGGVRCIFAGTGNRNFGGEETDDEGTRVTAERDRAFGVAPAPPKLLT